MNLFTILNRLLDVRLEQVHRQTGTIQLIRKVNARHLMQRGHERHGQIDWYIGVGGDQIIQLNRRIDKCH